MLSFLPDHLLYSLPPLHYYPPRRYYESDIEVDMSTPGADENISANGHGYTANFIGAHSLAPNRPRPPNTPPRRGVLSESALPATPVTQRLGYTNINKNGSHQNGAVKDYLQALLTDKVNRNYNTVEFIEAVWGLPREELKEPAGGYKLPIDAVNQYIGATYSKIDTDTGSKIIAVERSAYEPLSEIFSNISLQIGAAYRHQQAGLYAIFIVMRDRIVKGHFAHFRPDLLFSWLAAFEKQSWLLASLCGELKKQLATKSITVVENVDIKKVVNLPRKKPEDISEPPASSSTPPAAAPESEPAASRSTKRKAQSMVSHEPPPATKKSRSRGHDNPAPAPVLSRPSKIRSMKKKDGTLPLFHNPQSISMSASSSAPAASAIPATREATKEQSITSNELQIIKYINELGSHGIRSYATGFLIVDYDITLWYIDRMGVVSSTSFDFIQEPHLLVYFIAAVTRANATSLGFSSLLRFPEPSPGRSLTPQTFSQYDGVKMVLPTAQDIDGNVFENVEFLIDVDTGKQSTRRIVPTYGAVGRATVVIPIVTTEVMAKKIHVLASDARTLVAKVSWQSEGRSGEDDTIRDIHKTLTNDPSRKGFLENIVTLKLSMTRTMEEMELPRAKMFGLGKPEVERRVCRVLVMHEYLPLTAVKSVLEFQTVFADVLYGHNAVYEGSNVLHRDVSVNNIMFYYDQIDGEKRVVGVLCDWDLAKKVERPHIDAIKGDLMKALEGLKKIPDDHELKTSETTPPTVQQPSEIVANVGSEMGVQAPRYRTGTGPFIALDILLYNHAPIHLYRHDLESFFWVLVWFVATFKPKSQSCGVIRPWLCNDLASIGKAKLALLNEEPDWEAAIDQNADKAYKVLCKSIDKLRDTVILPLYKEYVKARKTYFDAVKAIEEARESKAEKGVQSLGTSKAPRWGKHATSSKSVDKDIWAKMQREIDATVADRELILTFDSFLQCLE
ncbi:hypothetical protein BXZ70DRAFT_959636 [Cristinia sonorae]|uniref:Fungal-type protein kinase domain-containing protein n=1 Tax=Cristinia sonorae TaxID=1940300 RepID=A0A8K0UFS1_9AGAR|nr:hypothetical protein BXZ70DRAFT_959636 [Cristinia sonorae]